MQLIHATRPVVTSSATHNQRISRFITINLGLCARWNWTLYDYLVTTMTRSKVVFSAECVSLIVIMNTRII